MIMPNDRDKKASDLGIDTQAPGEQGKRREFGQAGDAKPERTPGEAGRGDLSDADRAGSHGQGLKPHEDAVEIDDLDESDSGPER
jgi:hypothetical protein